MHLERVRQGEVLPVPQDRIQSLFRFAARWLKKIPDYDLNRARVRLLSCEDRLWLVAITKGKWPGWGQDPYMGAAITTILDRPPTGQKKAFERKDPADRRSLRVHLFGIYPGCWIESAVERISAYGHDEKCRMLFVMARKRWRHYATRFWSPDWDIVGYTRDRATKLNGGSHYPGWNKVGNYRIVLPLYRPLRDQDYNTGTKCYFDARPRDSV